MKQLIEVGVLGGLLAAALIGTYVVYFDDGSSNTDDGEGVDVYVADASQLTGLTYATKDKTVRLERKSDDRGEYLWVTMTTRTEQVPDPVETDTDDTDTDTEPPAPPAPVTVESTEAFLGSDAADKLWENWAPLRADRELAATTSDVDFGFDEPFGTITVGRKSGDVELVLGNTTFGDRSRYLKYGDRVFLLAKKELSRLESADTSLPERRMHPLKPNEIVEARVTRGDTTRTWVQKNPDDKVRAYWADPATPDTEDKAATGWLATAVKLGVQDYLSEPPVGLTDVLSIDLTDKAGASWSIQVQASDEQPPAYYARSAYNRSLVSLTPSQAEDLVVDLDTVMAGPAE